MRLALALALALALDGCGGSSNVQANSNGGSAASASIPGASRLGTLLSLVFLGAVSYESDREMARASRMPSPSYGPGQLPVPEPDPLRRIVEQDCSQPIEDSSANLRCR